MSSYFIEGRLRSIFGLFKEALWMDGMGWDDWDWDGVVINYNIIGSRSSKITFGANNTLSTV